MKKVVVVDDEPFILMMVEDKLRRAGIEVITTRHSGKAVELVRSERPDLVILDWMMPEVSGLELCRQLKDDPELAAIPIMMLTAKAQPEDERLGLKLGVRKYITKPFSPKALLEDVAAELGLVL